MQSFCHENTLKISVFKGIHTERIQINGVYTFWNTEKGINRHWRTRRGRRVSTTFTNNYSKKMNTLSKSYVQLVTF